MKALVKYYPMVIAIIVITGCTYNTTVKEDKKDSVGRQTQAKRDEQDNPSTGKTTPGEKVSDAWLLVPGQSAGATRLNENAEEVYTRLGNADGGDAAMQKAVAIWYTNHDSTNHSVAIYTQRSTEGNNPPALIKQIRITSPTFKTVEGIGPGSSLNEIQKTFEVKQPEQYTDEGTSYKVYDSPKGIAFEVGPGGNCVAVVVHEVGITGQGTYLKFRTTNKFISRKKA